MLCNGAAVGADVIATLVIGATLGTDETGGLVTGGIDDGDTAAATGEGE